MGKEMSRLYFIVLLSTLILGAYFYGVNIAKARCQIQYIKQEQQNQEIIIKDKRKIHETVYKTGVADIRSILRDKYSIAE